MISDEALALAVEQAVITADQAERLRAFERVRSEGGGSIATGATEAKDDETLRFVTGFADIFVTIGILLFVGALAFIMDAGSGSTPMFAGIACATWLLAEFFTGRKRMALPSIVLLVLFVGAVFLVSVQVSAAILPTSRALAQHYWFLPTKNPGALAVAAIATTALTAMHYLRFHVPITIAAGAAVLCVLALGLVALVRPDMGGTLLNAALIGCGLAVFALAMAFDMSDPQRVTRRTDIAFWLQLLAAPLIVHPLIRGVFHVTDGDVTPGMALGVLWIFIALGIVAVIIDRRAILVAGLLYAGIAFGTLFKDLGFDDGSRFLIPSVALTLGAFILLLSAGWQPLRRAILRRLPQSLARRLPHPLVPSST